MANERFAAFVPRVSMESVANFYEVELLHFHHDACRHALHGICQNPAF